MNRLDALLRALARDAELADWTAGAEVRRVAWDGIDGDRRSEGRRTVEELHGQVHRDVAIGRGSSRFTVDASAALGHVVADASRRALAAVGPPWRSSPPAAMAQVSLADPDVRPSDVGAVSRRLVEEIRAAAGAAGAALECLDCEVEHAEVRAASSRGLRATWNATQLGLDAVVVRRGARARLRRRARRYRDLDLGVELEAALEQAERRTRAQPTPAGRYAVIARARALVHDEHDGWFAAWTAQADPVRERHGLVRYRPGQEIIAGAAAIDEPLTVSSDGAIPFGLRSAPLTLDAEPIRRFELITRGVARGLALAGREAYRRGAEPNGGVRGLVVATGDIAVDDLRRDRSTLWIEAFDWVDLSPATGEVRAAIGLARWIEGDRRVDVTGGIVRTDAITALALARRSRETEATNTYRGPAAWELGRLLVE